MKIANVSTRASTLILAGVLTGAAGVATAQPAGGAAPADTGFNFEGYDFGVVVQTMEDSVSPLQREMDLSFKVFLDRMEVAEQQLDEGQTNEAVREVAAAIDGVLEVRDDVLGPMWDGQRTLQEQTARARQRLARAVGTAPADGQVEIDKDAEATLDAIAGRIAQENDPLRKKRLVAHYRTARNLARIRVMAQQLTPDQRRLWLNVLTVLDEAALAHQQVLMGTEVLFAQFEATSANLREYMALMGTVEGASRLMEMVRGVGEDGAGMTGFVSNMQDLQERLVGFNDSVEQALESRMMALDDQLQAIAPFEGGESSVVVSGELDGELEARIDRLQKGQP
ncbi:MAG: hypothetical protein AAGG38_07615 [Planctomycetota bacterium]